MKHVIATLMLAACFSTAASAEEGHCRSQLALLQEAHDLHQYVSKAREHNQMLGFFLQMVGMVAPPVGAIADSIMRMPVSRHEPVALVFLDLSYRASRSLCRGDELYAVTSSMDAETIEFLAQP